MIRTKELLLDQRMHYLTSIVDEIASIKESERYLARLQETLADIEKELLDSGFDKCATRGCRNLTTCRLCGICGYTK